MVHIFERKVNYYETDKMGITHHSNYVRYMEETRIDFMERAGYGYERMEAEGVGSPVMAVELDYKSPTTYPDVIRIELSVAEMSALKVRFAYRMYVGERLVCRATSLHCFIGKDGRPVRFQERFPQFDAILFSVFIHAQNINKWGVHEVPEKSPIPHVHFEI